MTAPTTTTRIGGAVAGWTARGLSAVLDQGLFATSNLVVNVLLARWLTPREYGAFVAAYAVLLLIAIAHSALVIEPMMVFGPARYADRFIPYLNHVLRLHWIFSAATLLLLLLTAVVLEQLTGPLLGHTFIGLAIAAPFYLLSWLARRACYTVGRPQLAATAGAIYAVVAAGGALLSAQLSLLTAFVSQLLIGLAGLTAAAVILQVLRRGTHQQSPPDDMREVLRMHWRFGRWIIGSGLLYWLQGQVFYLVLPIWSGLEASAALRALTNLVMPVLQSDAALTTLLSPELARVRASRTKLSCTLRWATWGFAIEGILCWALVALFRRPLVFHAYGERYADHLNLLLALGALPLLASRLNVLGALLRTYERTHQLFLASAISAGVSLIVGLATIQSLGVAGAVFAQLLSHVCQIAVMTYFLRGSKTHHVAAVPLDSIALEVPQ